MYETIDAVEPVHPRQQALEGALASLPVARQNVARNILDYFSGDTTKETDTHNRARHHRRANNACRTSIVAQDNLGLGAEPSLYAQWQRHLG
jgi:hypothetical protein